MKHLADSLTVTLYAWESNLKKEIKKLVNKLANEIIKDWRAYIRQHKLTGEYEKSITKKITTQGNLITMAVFSTSSQVVRRSIEEGSRPHWMPISAAEKIAKYGIVHNPSPYFAYAIQKSIAKKGTVGINSYGNVLEPLIPYVKNRLQNIVEEAKKQIKA